MTIIDLNIKTHIRIIDFTRPTNGFVFYFEFIVVLRFSIIVLFIKFHDTYNQ
jgi:hypothetical protein